MREPNAVNQFVRISPQTHMFEPAWMYRDILPYWLEPDQGTNPTGLITLSSLNPVTVPYKLPHGSLSMDGAVGNPLEIRQVAFTETLVGRSTADFTVFMTDMGDQRQFMNYPIHVRTFAGSGQLPALLSEPLFMPTRHQLMLTCQQLPENPVSQAARLNFNGKMYYTWSTNLQNHPTDHAGIIALVNKALERRKYVFPYWMTPQNGAVAIPANKSVDVDALIGSEGHFECTHILRPFTGGTQTAAPFQVEIINPQTRQSIMNGAIHSYMIGDAQNPQPFPAPFIIPAGQTLRFRITDLSGSANTVYLTLRGRKIRSEFKDIAQVKKEFGIKDGKTDDTAKSYKNEMAGVSA